MNPIAFAGSRPIQRPPNMTDEQCSPLEIIHGVDAGNFPYYLSCWQPSAHDIAAFSGGRPVWLKILGDGHPPVSLFTLDDQGNLNP